MTQRRLLAINLISPIMKELEMIKLIVAFIGISFLFFGSNMLIMSSYAQPQGVPSQGGLVQQQAQSAQSQQILQQLRQQQDAIQQQLKQLQNLQNQIEQRLNPLQLEPNAVQLLQQPQAQQQLTPQQKQQIQQGIQQAQQLTPQENQQASQLQQLLQQMQTLQRTVDQLKLQETQVQQLSQPAAQQLTPPNQQQQPQEIPVTVRFESIKIIDDNDPDPKNVASKAWGFAKSLVTGGSATKDGGDWILDAFVNGQNVHLSANKLLDEVFTGQTYRFPPTAQVTVNVPSDGYLPVNIIGTDVDSCSISDNVITGILSVANTQFGGYTLGDRIEKALAPGMRDKLLAQSPTTTPQPGQNPTPSWLGRLLAGQSSTTPQQVEGMSTVNQVFDSIAQSYVTSTATPAAPGPAAAAILGPKVYDTVKSTLGGWIRNILCRSDPNDIIGDVNDYIKVSTIGPTPKSISKESDTGEYVIYYTISARR